MGPDPLKDDGSINPFWVMWATEKLQSLFQSAGPEMEVNQAGIQLTEPEQQQHWVRVTAVDNSVNPPRHSVEEVFRDPDATTPYDWGRRAGGLLLDAANGWAVEAAGGAAAVGDVVQVFRDGSGVWTFSLGGSGAIRRGVLDGDMSQGGSATVSIWAVTSGVDGDTGANVTAYDWLLASGQSLLAGTHVVVGYDAASDRWYVVNGRCQE